MSCPKHGDNFTNIVDTCILCNRPGQLKLRGPLPFTHPDYDYLEYDFYVRFHCRQIASDGPKVDSDGEVRDFAAFIAKYGDDAERRWYGAQVAPSAPPGPTPPPTAAPGPSDGHGYRPELRSPEAAAPAVHRAAPAPVCRPPPPPAHHPPPAPVHRPPPPPAPPPPAPVHSPPDAVERRPFPGDGHLASQDEFTRRFGGTQGTICWNMAACSSTRLGSNVRVGGDVLVQRASGIWVKATLKKIDAGGRFEVEGFDSEAGKAFTKRAKVDSIRPVTRCGWRPPSEPLRRAPSPGTAAAVAVARIKAAPAALPPSPSPRQPPRPPSPTLPRPPKPQVSPTSADPHPRAPPSAPASVSPPAAPRVPSPHVTPPAAGLVVTCRRQVRPPRRRVGAAPPAIQDATAGRAASLFKEMTASKDAINVGSDQATAFVDYVCEHRLLRVVVGAVLVPAMSSSQTDKATDRGRVAACSAVAMLSGRRPGVSPFMVPLLPRLLRLSAVGTRATRGAAEAAVDAVIIHCCPAASSSVATNYILPVCCEAQAKSERVLPALRALKLLCRDAPRCAAWAAAPIVDALADALHDTAPANRAEAASALEHFINHVVENPDVQPIRHKLFKALLEPEYVTGCIEQAAQNRFAHRVSRAELALVSRVLVRGFREQKNTFVVRLSARIAENLAVLLERPEEIDSVVPVLLAAVSDAAAIVADPECRSVCENVRDLLQQLHRRPRRVDELPYQDILAGVSKEVEWFVTERCSEMAERGIPVRPEELLPLLAEDGLEGIAAEGIAQLLCGHVADGAPDVGDSDDDDRPVLCRCTLSLAYGVRTLLSDSPLTLRRGHRYGVVGPNGSGKSTLLHAIADGKVDNLPDVRCVLVQAADQPAGDESVMDWAAHALADSGVRADELQQALLQHGFLAPRDRKVSSLSGGWRMKLEVVVAILRQPDILLLDEPTNHLDEVHATWLKDLLCGLQMTVLVVSHDVDLLSRCCTRIVHFEGQKLRAYSSFVEYSLTGGRKSPAAAVGFRFPQPTRIEGVTTRTRTIVRLRNVSFTYPGADQPAVSGVNVRVSMATRALCRGPNGAGKTTMIGLLTGRLQPGTGSCETKDGVLVTHVSQNAFDHIEKHLQMTANKYIQWRFSALYDKEGQRKQVFQVTPAEEAVMAVRRKWDYFDEYGGKRRRELSALRLTGGRRTVSSSWYYHVAFDGDAADEKDGWVERAILEANGWGKQVAALNERLIAEAEARSRPLTERSVGEHLEHAGISRELGSHTALGVLSSGQRAKVALAACVWGNPHVLCLDEPTNYLDSDALASLADAIENYQGGVVIVTHNESFGRSLCQEVWTMEGGQCRCDGDAAWIHTGSDSEPEEPAKPTRRERRSRESRKKWALQAGLPWESDSDSDA